MIHKALKKLVPSRLIVAYYTCTSYKAAHGCYPNIFTPKTFTEKIQKRKIFDRDPLLSIRADKVLVKEFVRQKLGKEWVTPTLWHGATLPPPNERNWSLPFVIKANHGSGANIFIRTKTECDWPAIEFKIQHWMNNIHGYYFGEWLYSKIKPQLLIEPFITEISSLPTDYKLWTFHGSVEIIEVMSNRGAAQKRNFYDRNWKEIPFSQLFPPDVKEIPAPKSLKLMINAAELLSENMSFVRVDFYEIAEKPLFGELTFYPGSGYTLFNPVKYDKIIGKLWK